MLLAAREEVFLAFPKERHTIPLATEFRSTWLVSSLRSMRERGALDRYLSYLPLKFHEPVLSAVAGVWLPMDVALAHYEACDRLGYTYSELLAIGRDAGDRARTTVLSTAVRLTRQAGVTPWTVLAQLQRLWERMFKGGGVAAWKLGPKEARIELVGCPIARVPYFRVAMQGVLLGIGEMFCEKLYINEVAGLCTRTTLGYRGSWV
jgi:hypothetical protein